MAHAITLATLVGRRVRDRREELRLTQDELARGVGWARSALAKIERGERDVLGLDEVLLLSVALEVVPADLIGDDKQYVSVGPMTVPAGSIAAGLRGDQRWADLGSSRALLSTLKQTEQGGEADQKAASRLGLDLTELGVLTHHIWGRSLTAERDRRLAEQQRSDDTPRTVQARRGHLTRTLLGELEQHLEKARKNQPMRKRP